MMNKVIAYPVVHPQHDDGNSAENFRILKSGKQRVDVERSVMLPLASSRGDGRNRYRACEAAGIEPMCACPGVPISGKPEISGGLQGRGLGRETRPLRYGSPAAFLASPVSSRICSPVLARSTT
jgi:hypothetical protein